MIQLLRINGKTNPILESGQLGYDTYRHAIKIGDGSTDFHSLPATAADPSIYKADGINYGDSSGDIYMYGYQGAQILQSIAAGNRFYGNLEGTADNSLLFDDMTSDDVYHVNNKPTKADVGLDKVQNQYNYGHSETSGISTIGGYLQLGTTRLLASGFTFNGAVENSVLQGQVWVNEVTVDWRFNWSFATAPLVVLIPVTLAQSIISVKPARWGNLSIQRLQFYSTVQLDTASFTVHCLAFGEV